MKKANVRKPTAPWAAEIERQLVNFAALLIFKKLITRSGFYSRFFVPRKHHHGKWATDSKGTCKTDIFSQFNC